MFHLQIDKEPEEYFSEHTTAILLFQLWYNCEKKTQNVEVESKELGAQIKTRSVRPTFL